MVDRYALAKTLDERDDSVVLEFKGLGSLNYFLRDFPSDLDFTKRIVVMIQKKKGVKK